jgi:hypothetical protein
MYSEPLSVVEAENAKGNLMQDRLQYRSQKRLADLAHAAHYFPLRHRIRGVDVIHPFGPLPIALVHSVDAQKPRPPLRIRFAPFPYGDRARACRLPF